VRLLWTRGVIVVHQKCHPEKAFPSVSLMCPLETKRTVFHCFEEIMSSPFPVEIKIAVFHRFVVASWKMVDRALLPGVGRKGLDRKQKASIADKSVCSTIFHEATTNRWKTAIFISTGNGDDIISSKQWKTVLFVSSGHMRLTLGKAFSGWHFWCTTMTPLVHNKRTSRAGDRCRHLKLALTISTRLPPT
jgi:hypothetical protein